LSCAAISHTYLARACETVRRPQPGEEKSAAALKLAL